MLLHLSLYPTYVYVRAVFEEVDTLGLHHIEKYLMLQLHHTFISFLDTNKPQ